MPHSFSGTERSGGVSFPYELLLSREHRPQSLTPSLGTCTFPCTLRSVSCSSLICFANSVLMSRDVFSSRLSSSSVSSRLIFGRFRIFCEESPKRRVDIVSCRLRLEGEHARINVVTELPPIESCRMRVSLDSR